MSKWLLSAVSLAAILVLPALESRAEPNSAAWKELVKAARQEGKVEVILSGQVPRLLRVAMPEFEKKYGVKVNFQTGSGRAHSERILAERRVGRFTVDIWLGGANTALKTLLPNKVLAPVPGLLVDPEVANQSLWYKGKHYYSDPKHRYIFVWGASPARNVAINTNMVKPEEIKSYADLLDPKWKGKIVSWSPGKQGTGASAVPMYLNPKIGETWFRRWATEMKVTIVEDARQGAEWVALGRFPIGMFGMTTQAEVLRSQGLPVIGYLPHAMAEGEVLSASAANIMAVDRAPNPNAMKLFLNWVLSRDAQSLFLKTAKRIDSLRTDVDNSVLDEVYRIDPKGDYFVAFADDDYINRQAKIIENLRKIMREAGYK